MNEINRILDQLSKQLDGQCDLSLIREAMVKSAYAVILDNGVALSVCSYVQGKINESK